MTLKLLKLLATCRLNLFSSSCHAFADRNEIALKTPSLLTTSQFSLKNISRAFILQSFLTKQIFMQCNTQISVAHAYFEKLE